MGLCVAYRDHEGYIFQIISMEKKMFNSKVFLAEFIGTFALVFVGMSAGIVQAGLVGVALAHGFTTIFGPMTARSWHI